MLNYYFINYFAMRCGSTYLHYRPCHRRLVAPLTLHSAHLNIDYFIVLEKDWEPAPTDLVQPSQSASSEFSLVWQIVWYLGLDFNWGRVAECSRAFQLHRIVLAAKYWSPHRYQHFQPLHHSHTWQAFAWAVPPSVWSRTTASYRFSLYSWDS